MLNANVIYERRDSGVLVASFIGFKVDSQLDSQNHNPATGVRPRVFTFEKIL